MGRTTAIGWCDHTFNGVRGCVKVSEGCKFCYAERDSRRFPGMMGEWGPLGRRRVARASYWSQLGQWDAAARDAGGRRKVFAYSFADVFEQHSGPLWWAKARKDDPDERVRQDELLANGSAEFAAMDHVRLKLFDAIRRTPNLIYLLLTKRSESIRDTIKRVAMVTEPGDPMAIWLLQWLAGQPPENVWLGTSVEDQETADARIPHLLDVPAAVRWISYEPALGPVWFKDALGSRCLVCSQPVPMGEFDCIHDGGAHRYPAIPGISWVIVGGESGAKGKARPFDVAWARDTIRQCKAAGVACFVKQLGAAPRWSEADVWAGQPDKRDQTGAWSDPAEWPSDINVQQFPHVGRVAEPQP